ncbi:MAG TPA: putative photosynthetic complex assembly protein PuhE [Woeseiaceae bacterium]|nr:putative photosynthetic complex assembly protein PuhE [Woeseiaceae bacterium]
MPEYVLPVLYALFLWWFSTGVVFYADGLPKRTFPWSMAGATAVLVAALAGLAAAADDTTLGGAYLSFSCGLLAWVWVEASYYLGYLTGPRKHRCEEGCSGWRHFGHALQTSYYHEAAIVVLLLVMALATAAGPNKLGLWTFVVLLAMHESARLNVFLGVRNLNEQLLPDHLAYLASFLRRRPMNLLFPFSVTVATVTTAWMVGAAAAATTPHDAAAWSFLAALMAVGVLEHWFLVLPLDISALWRWSLGSRRAGAPEHEERADDGPASVFAGRY